MPEQAVCGWANIHKMMPLDYRGKPLMSLRSLQDRGPEMKARGILWKMKYKHNICCFPSHFRAYIMEIAREGKRF